MSTPSVPELSLELAKRIRLVRRDVGSLLFHFTRKPAEPFVVVATPNGDRYTPSSGSAVLRKILYEARLTGSDKWSPGYPCVCFTEAPIQEFNAIFSLVEIAASKQEKPRYEPYGIAVSKKWLFAQGGRPVIYDRRPSVSPSKCQSSLLILLRALKTCRCSSQTAGSISTPPRSFPRFLEITTEDLTRSLHSPRPSGLRGCFVSTPKESHVPRG